jgi:hypothetical protein
MDTQRAIGTPIEQPDEDLLVLSNEEIFELIDTGAREMLGISGEEFLRRRREGEKGENGAWRDLSMLASLLDD